MQSYFDPKTGELIGGEIDNSAQTQSQQADYQQNYQQNYQQSYQQPQQPKNGGNKKLFIGVGIGCGALVLVGIIIFVASRILMSNPIMKICTAVENTFKIGQLQEVLNPEGIVNKDSMSFDILLEYDDDKVGIAGAYQITKQKKAINAKVDFDIDGEEIGLEGTAELDKERIAISIPELDDIIYTYYYTRENDGYLVDEFEDEMEMINEFLISLYEYGNDDNDEAVKAMREIFINELKNIEIEDLKEEEFEIDNKDVKCGGYLVTISEDNVMNVLEQLEDVYDEYYADSAGDMIEEIYADPDDFFAELEYIFEDMPDIELSFYIYKKQLACFTMEIEDEVYYMYFHGGDYPLQNMEIVVDDNDELYTVLETQGSVKNRIETMVVTILDEEICEINYNQKTGELEISGGNYLDMDLSAIVTRKGNTLTLELDEFEIEGESLSGSIILSGDAKINALKGKEFDMGNASEDEWEDLGDELIDFLEDKELY